MTAVPAPETPCPADVVALIALAKTGDLDSTNGLYGMIADATDGEPMLRPLNAKMRPDFREKDPSKFETTTLPVGAEEIARLVVVVRAIPLCAPETTALVTFAQDTYSGFSVHVVAGPPQDKSVARSVICRDIGIYDAPDTFGGEPQAANDNEPVVAHKYALPPMHPNPWTPEGAGGLLGDVSRWITSTAIIPVSELSVASSLALLAGMFGDRALGPTQSGLNLFVTTLMDTASGKGHPPKAMRKLADMTGRPGAVTNGDPTSYAALERILRKNPSTVTVLDEFGVTLQDVNSGKTSASASSIRKFVLAIYDQANSKFEGRQYASSETKKDDSAIDGPALTMLGMTTPGTLYAGLSEAAIGDGFLNRFLFVRGSVPSDIQPPPLQRDSNPPKPLVEALRAAVVGFPKAAGNVAAILGKVTLPFSGGDGGAAHKRWQNVFMWEKANAWTETERHINGRAAENTIRLATLRAVSRDPASPAITAEDVDWGFAIVHQSIEIISEGVARHMSASPAEALRKAIVEALRTAVDQTLAYSKILERSGVRGSDTKQVQEALRWLSDTGRVVDLANRAGGPGKGSKLRLVLTA